MVIDECIYRGGPALLSEFSNNEICCCDHNCDQGEISAGDIIVLDEENRCVHNYGQLTILVTTGYGSLSHNPLLSYSTMSPKFDFGYF